MIASLLDSSDAACSFNPASLKSPSIATRVPEPRSLTSRFADSRSGRLRRFACMSGCDGAATNAIGCFANAAAFVRNSRGCRPMIARSISFVASIRTMSSRLPMRNCSFTPGRSFVKRTSSGGTRYSAVVIAPMRNVPPSSPRSAATSSPASFHRLRISFA
ncbi:hypothetical protein BG58_15775 [Caballeronia jiangsuensis]|nr:hypothetical protein BG58_15775 [Caballeronia jiangsuensis]